MKKFNLIMAGIVSTSVIAPITAFAGDITVKRGDTLSELAVKHNTSVSQIKSMNGLKNNVIRIGQKLKISTSVVNSKTGVIANCTYLNVRTAPNTSSKIKTTVKAGTKVEILSEKGSWYQVKANGATGYVSSKYVKGSNVVVPVSNPVKAKGGTTYTVVRGDTLSEIAVKHKTTIAKIKADNGMRSNTVYIGQKLKINGGGSATVTKPVTNASVHTVVRGDTLSEVAAKYGMSVNTLKSLNSLRTNTIYLGQKLKVTGNPIKAESKKIFQRPTVTNRVTSVYGPRSIGYHYGIDYALPGNQKIMAAADGVVSKSYEHHLWGEVVFIKHVINGKSYETIYAHLRENSRAVKAGDRVKAGQFIGWMGSTGNSTGQHLHFEIHPGGYVSQAKTAVDPAPYIK